MKNRCSITLLVLLLGVRAYGSDPIPASYGGAGSQVTQPHVTAELIPETTLVQEGKPFDVALHFHTDPGWHTYWINPGEAGLATTIDWQLPPGFSAGSIQWPTPEIHAMGPITTYGYAGDVYLLTTITPPKDEGNKVIDLTLKAQAKWLVCQEECIPGKADLEVKVSLAGRNAALDEKAFDNRELFSAARVRLPVPNTRWEVKGTYGPGPGLVRESLWTQFRNRSGNSLDRLGHLYFFPEQANVLSSDESKVSSPFFISETANFTLILPLQQNGEKPAQISGVLVSDLPLMANSKSIYLSAFSTEAKDISMPSASLGDAPTLNVSEAGPPGASFAPAAVASAPPPVAQPWLIGVLGAAFLGGLILNLMPCVLPVLSLKVFSLIRHAGENPGAAWQQGVAFTAGVVISFWALAGLLLVLRAAGNQLGWGFQMQSPGFVLALIFLFFLLSLNLFGVFEFGTSLVGLDAKASGRAEGLTSSFLNGALATLAATPCTAPFMGSSVGFAAQQPPLVSLLIFTVLALGMATPYLLLTAFPAALRFVPRPGAWMDALRQFMGFLLLATVIFLVYVFATQVGTDQVFGLLATLLIAGLAAWIYGRWSSPLHPAPVRIATGTLAVLILVGALGYGATLTKEKPVVKKESIAEQVAAGLKAQRPVFVDFTAAWCLSCKVNEAVALNTSTVQTAFQNQNVLQLRADWTHNDPEISDLLRSFNRDGVPLYLLYSPQNPKKPQVLPEVLTPGIVLEALQKL